MVEIEVPLEKTMEDIHHAAHHDNDGLVGYGALLSAFFAAFAAVCALFAGHFSNEAMINQIQSSDHWSHYQAKGIKMAVAEMKISLGGQINENDRKDAAAKVERYKEEQKEIKGHAEAKAKESAHELKKHEILAASVTFFQVSIALTAIAVLTKKRKFLLVACLLGVIGVAMSMRTFFVH